MFVKQKVRCVGHRSLQYIYKQHHLQIFITMINPTKLFTLQEVHKLRDVSLLIVKKNDLRKISYAYVIIMKTFTLDMKTLYACYRTS
jgi:hypothetical protein